MLFRSHPDTQSEDKKEWAEAKFKEINEAYEILSNEASRKNYDIELEYDKDSAIKAICVKNEHLQNLVNELQNELNVLKKHINSKNKNTINSEINSYNTSEYVASNEQAHFTEPQEYVYYETKIPYTKNKLKDLLAFVITIFCILFVRIFALENSFY